jgi:hypothetical protein
MAPIDLSEVVKSLTKRIRPALIFAIENSVRSETEIATAKLFERFRLRRWIVRTDGCGHRIDSFMWMVSEWTKRFSAGLDRGYLISELSDPRPQWQIV